VSIYPRPAHMSGVIPVRAWRVRNFKSIAEAELALAPLTVLVGANSSGKTSLIQSILLVAQAAQGGNQGSTFPLNGPLVSAGGFDEARFAHSRGAALGIGATLELSSEVAMAGTSVSRAERTRLGRTATLGVRWVMKWEATFDAPAVNEPGSAEIASVDLGVEQIDQEPEPGSQLKLSSSRRGQGQVEADRERRRLGNLVLPTRDVFSLGFIGELSASDINPLPIRGLLLRAALPHNVVTTSCLGDAAASVWAESRMLRPFWTASSGVREVRSVTATRGEAQADEATLAQWAGTAAEEIREWNSLRALEPVSLPAFLARSRQRLPQDVRLALREQMDELVDAIRRKLDLDEEVFLPERHAAGWLNDVVSEAHSFFRERVVYLGPLRQDPQVVYKTAPVDAAGFIGTKGEYLATVLHASRAREVLSFREDGAPEPMSLAEALNRWTVRLGIADAIQTRDLGRLGIQVSVQRGGIPAVDLTSVGVGVSQLLPVIVMCLLAEPGSLLLLEQPELHLHPGLQQKLGDFLLACARSGRQLIVETHSEYLVSRLRRWIAEDEAGELLEALAVYFVEQKEDASEFRKVAVNEFGGVEDWPVGFFDQAATESRRILEARLKKRGRGAGQADAHV
jgi:predicted ATPase